MSVVIAQDVIKKWTDSLQKTGQTARGWTAPGAGAGAARKSRQGDNALEGICGEIWQQVTGGHLGKQSWYWEVGNKPQGWEVLVLGNLGTGGTEKYNQE